MIVRLTKSLEYVDSFAGPGGDPFHGPERFVAILNKKITLIDEFASSPDFDRLASFGDMNGAGWQTFGSTGTGVDQFMFFEQFAAY
jgi:hypothetical protein